MKKVLLLISFLACGAAQYVSAEIHENYNAPELTYFDIIEEEGVLKATIILKAPSMGGELWKSNISFENPSGGMTVTEGSASLQAGGNGSEMSSGVSTSSFKLSTPAVSLTKGKTYQFTYKSAGSRGSSNKHMSVLLQRAGQTVQTLKADYELSASLMYELQTISFSVEESGDYAIVFDVTNPSGKSSAISCRDFVLTEPAPEGQGALLGYNFYLNGEQKEFFTSADVQNNIYYSTSELAYSTAYTVAIQAVYEGGESPLSNSMSKTSKKDLTAIQSLSTSVATSVRAFTLQGTAATNNTRGIVVRQGQKFLNK